MGFVYSAEKRASLLVRLCFRTGKDASGSVRLTQSMVA